MSPSRSRQPGSLSTVIADCLDDFNVPLPNEVVRVLATSRRAKPTTPEQLSRVAAYEKTSFIQNRLPPLLCNVIDETGHAVRPRIWARGDWRLGRRIITPDTVPKWQEQLAVHLCHLMVTSEKGNPSLANLALEAVARVLGPVASFLPGSDDEWSAFSQRIRLDHPDPDPFGMTSGQSAAEHTFNSPESGLTPASLYFGFESNDETRPSSTPRKLRLPGEGDTAQPFDQVVAKRLKGDEDATRNLLAYLQAWSRLHDELRRAPTTTEFAERWGYSLPATRIEEERFSTAFPEEPNGPEPVVRLLDSGLPKAGELVPWTGIRVVDSSPVTVSPAPAVGQRWIGADGSVLKLTWVDGPEVVGELEHNGTSSLWAASTSKLLRDFHLEAPKKTWHVKFDVDVVPFSLNDVLHDGGVAPTRFARPADPRPGEPLLRAGTIEAQVVARSESEARMRVVEALQGRVELGPEDISAKRL